MDESHHVMHGLGKRRYGGNGELHIIQAVEADDPDIISGFPAGIVNGTKNAGDHNVRLAANGRGLGMGV